MIRLSDEQKLVVNQSGNVVVTACPGSGKTRVLMARVIKGLQELISPKQRVIALTFTNRATDEIRSRLDQLSISQDQLWAGTIHAFTLEWILRPYAPYNSRLQKGFSIADEFFTEQNLEELKRAHGVLNHVPVNCARDRNGEVTNYSQATSTVFQAYQTRLLENKLLDYDDVLFLAYRLLTEIPEIATTLASIIRLVCVDEIQDVQDLQYGILSAICKNSTDPPTLFLVGDPDQCIYESLGAITKSPDEIAEEFGLQSIKSMNLTGNYRSTQRVIDFYQHLRPGPRIQSLTDYAADHGTITFHDQTVVHNDLPTFVAQLIRECIESGIAPSEVCVLAPHWWHIHALGRSLVRLLPDIDFDAPGLSPLHCQRENFWFKVARIFLTTPSPRLYQTRLRWAGEVIRDLQEAYSISLSGSFVKPRGLLRLFNSISSSAQEGLDFLYDVFGITIAELGIDLSTYEALRESRELFFEKAMDRIDSIGNNIPTDVQSFKKLFKHPFGVVISTCHGVKGEEYDTVIAYGLLKGYIPNWEVIINGSAETAADQESKLLYVICSRAKRRLHLIAESGRQTRRGNLLGTATLLRSFEFEYD